MIVRIIRVLSSANIFVHMYYVVYGFFYLLSLLPFPVIYSLSDGISFLLYYVIRYRRKVVKDNLLIAFPEKTEAERRKIEREFYTHFSDNWLEFVKLLSISEKELNKRFTGNYDLLNELYKTGQSAQVYLGHYFNWEYANVAYGMNVESPFLVVYKPIANKTIDRLFYKVRTRFGSHMISAYNYRQEFIPFTKRPFVLVLVADQRELSDKAYWAPFFGKLTTFVQGPERTAKMNEAAVTMARIKKIKRGYYQSEAVLLTTDPKSLPKGEITKKMIAFVEDCVREQPANYLWSHKRWRQKFDKNKHRVL